jgi:AraC-like DNA-binding protein
MNLLLSIFGIISFLLALLASLILFFFNKEQTFSNRLLAVVLFFLGAQMFIIFIVYSGLIIKIPHIYRVFGPSAFLILPLSYLYVRSILKSETNIQKYDWFILIPSILYTIYLIPVYALSTENKVALVTKFVTNPRLQAQFSDGFVPPYAFSFIRSAWSAIFVFLQFRLIKKFQKEVTYQFLEVNRDLIQWLTLFTRLLLFLILVVIVCNVLAPVLEISSILTEVALQLTVCITVVKLFMQPKLLYGLHIPSGKFNLNVIDNNRFKDESVIFNNSVKNSVFLKTVQTNLMYKEKIDAHFKENVPFLNPDYSLNDLVDEIKVPRHLLSSFINQEYGLGFRKFLNRKRVEYVMENFNKPEWQNLTLEAIGNESGFRNRSTFIINFKGVTGENPSEYFKSNN